MVKYQELRVAKLTEYSNTLSEPVTATAQPNRKRKRAARARFRQTDAIRS